MRKWIRDRVKGRRKPSEKKAEPTQAPLQPAYFDAGPPAADAAAAEAPVEIPADVAHQDLPSSTGDEQEGSEATPLTDSAATGPKRRRRRGRGGRGRSRSALTTTSATEAKPPSIPPETLAPAAPATAAAAPKVPKGTVVLAIGLPGSGKSSWFKRHNITPLSSDLLRSLLFDDPTEQRFQDLVFSNLRSMLKARLIARRPMNYVDATNLTSHDRHSWIKLAKDFGYEVQAVFFDVPLEVCLERNRKRERVVGEDALRRLASKMKQPTFEEGFSKITVVRVKAKQEGSGAEPS
jgi:predicted kinase